MFFPATGLSIASARVSGKPWNPRLETGRMSVDGLVFSLQHPVRNSFLNPQPTHPMTLIRRFLATALAASLITAAAAQKR